MKSNKKVWVVILAFAAVIGWGVGHVDAYVAVYSGPVSVVVRTPVCVPTVVVTPPVCVPPYLCVPSCGAAVCVPVKRPFRKVRPVICW